MRSRWGARAYIVFASLAAYAVILMQRPFTGNFVERLLSRLLLIPFALAAFVAVFAQDGLWLLTFVLLMVRLHAFRQRRLAANDPIPAGYPRLIS